MFGDLLVWFYVALEALTIVLFLGLARRFWRVMKR